MSFTLPELGYDYNSLEPHIDAKTMEIHHSMHHAGYVAKLNAAIDGTDLGSQSVCDLISSLSDVPGAIRGAVRNNGGGHCNHSLFWKIISPGGSDHPERSLASDIDSSFGSFDSFKEKFETAACTQFGSGWTWLLLLPDGRLTICSTANQDNPRMEGEGTPILGIDVWEHAYYLNYQNRRPEYVSAFWNIVNWTEVDSVWNQAKGESCCCD